MACTGLTPAINNSPRHQITFKWTDTASFLKNAAPPSCAFLKQLSLSGLVHDEKSRIVVATDIMATKLYGAAGMVMINDTAGYLCFCESDQDMLDYHVLVEVNKNDENCLQICSKRPANVAIFQGDFKKLHSKRDERCLEAHMFEAIISKAFGIWNFDLSRNVTYDIPNDSDRIALFRDQLGFILTDSRQFILLELSLKALVKHFYQGFQVQKHQSYWDIRTLDFKDESLISALGTFNKRVIGEDRLHQIRSTCQNVDSQCIVSLRREGDSKSVNGYVLFNRNNITCLYAKSQSIMESLLNTTISRMDNSARTITVFSTFNDGIHAWLQDAVPLEFTEATIYRRLHTLCIPKDIKWDYIYVANIGWQIA